jgi:hypothetical protein
VAADPEPRVQRDTELATPYQRRRPEPQTNQDISPQLDFLYKAEYMFAQWVQFADAKSGGVVLVLSIGALDVFRNSTLYLHPMSAKHEFWGWAALAVFLLSVGAIAVAVGGVARTLFPRVRESKPSDYFFGVAGSYPDGSDYGKSVKNRREEDLLEHVAIQAWNLGRIANDKYLSLRWAYIGALVFLVTWGVGRVALAFAS